MVGLLEIIGWIIGILIGIPIILIIIIQWFVEGQALSAILEGFGVHPGIIVFISIVGIIALIKIISEVLP